VTISKARALTGAALLLALAAPAAAATSTLSPNWENLTGPDFAKALKAADGVCVLPMGSVEKFGPSGPLGMNLIMARAVADEAAKQEYAVVFPSYFVASTSDVANHLGTISYSPEAQKLMLEETVAEMARNGCAKIVLSNGHSGNMGLINWFIASTMAKPHSYVVYSTYPAPPRMSPPTPETAKLPAEMRPSSPTADGHGGEERIALLMAVRPDLAHPERGHDEASVLEDSVKLPVPKGVGLGTDRFLEAPTSYIGDASGATAARGKTLLAYAANRLVTVLRAVKADQRSAADQKAFFEQLANPR
jgi:creatinine amidohydrolase